MKHIKTIETRDLKESAVKGGCNVLNISRAVSRINGAVSGRHCFFIVKSSFARSFYDPSV